MSGGTGRRLTAVVVACGAAVGFVQTYALPFAWNRGPGGRWWETVRRVVSRVLGAVFDERAGPRPVTAGEYAGTLALSLDGAERLLWQEGFVRNPFSRLKTRDGEHEAGSWVYRESPLSDRQLHLMLFRGGGGDGVDVYAHEELSSVNPFVGAAHFDGTTQNVAAGVARARERLPLDASDATTDPPDGPWHAGTPRR